MKIEITLSSAEIGELAIKKFANQLSTTDADLINRILNKSTTLISVEDENEGTTISVDEVKVEIQFPD
jgi:urease gamma subunit